MSRLAQNTAERLTSHELSWNVRWIGLLSCMSETLETTKRREIGKAMDTMRTNACFACQEHCKRLPEYPDKTSDELFATVLGFPRCRRPLLVAARPSPVAQGLRCLRCRGYLGIPPRLHGLHLVLGHRSARSGFRVSWRCGCKSNEWADYHCRQ